MKQAIRMLKTGGFTLIEVLVALVVVGIALVGLLQLQASFSNGVKDAELRSIAYTVAERQLEKLRNFQDYGEFYSIGSGAMPSSAAVGFGEGSFSYDLSWSVTAYSEAGSVAISSVDATYKEIEVTVDWDGSPQPITLSSIIAKINPDLSAFPGEESGAGGVGPTVSHALGVVPDVVPIELGRGKTRETALPLPETSNDSVSTEVQVVTVNYDTSENKQIKEDFLTVNCVCQLNENSANNLIDTPYHYRYNSESADQENLDELFVENGVSGVPEFTGSVYSSDEVDNQSTYCTKCCEGHHDVNPTSVTLVDYTKYPSFKQGIYDGTDSVLEHEHYKFDPATGLVSSTAAASGEPYLEACRFRRVDGLYELFTDWKLIDLNTFSLTYGSSTAQISIYQQYVKDKLREEVFTGFATVSSAVFTPENYETTANSYNQILARGIYLDDMSYDDAWVARRSTIAASAAWVSMTEPDWLGFVPLNEINLTLLADWEKTSDVSDAITSYTNEPVEDVDPDDYYAEGPDGVPGTSDDDGFYSRGNVKTAATATASSAAATITASSKTDNTGILGNRYGTEAPIGNGANPAYSWIDQDNAIVPSQTTISNYINITIGSDDGIVTVPVTVTKVGNVNLNKVYFTVSPNVGSCSLESVDADNTQGTYNCDVISGSTFTLTGLTTQNNEEVVLSSDPNSNSTSVTAPVAEDGGPAFILQDIP